MLHIPAAFEVTRLDPALDERRYKIFSGIALTKSLLRSSPRYVSNNWYVLVNKANVF